MPTRASFDFTNPIVLLRIAIGLLMVPHGISKITGFAGTAAFFAKAGFEPAAPFVVMAIVMELACAAGLTFDILTKWAGIGLAAVMIGASQALIATRGLNWLITAGGIEFTTLIGVCGLILSLAAWQQEKKAFGRVSLLFPRRAA